MDISFCRERRWQPTADEKIHLSNIFAHVFAKHSSQESIESRGCVTALIFERLNRIDKTLEEIKEPILRFSVDLIHEGFKIRLNHDLLEAGGDFTFES